MKKIFLFLLPIMILSCEKNNTDNEDFLADIIPLKVGNTWTYIDSFFYPNGTIYVDTTILKITNSGMFNYLNEDIELFYWTWFNSRKQEFNDYSWLCRNNEDGFYFYGGISETNSYILNKSLSLKFPVEIGDKWNQTTFNAVPTVDSTYFIIGDTLQIHCLATDESFSTPIKAFKCYKYYYTVEPAWEGDIPNNFYSLYVPGIGKVGEITENSGNIVYKRTLISYNF